MQSSKKKFDKLWTEFLRLKMSNKEIENLTDIGTIDYLLDDFTKEDLESKYFLSIDKQIDTIINNLGQKTPKVVKAFESIISKLRRISNQDYTTIRKSPSFKNLNKLEEKEEIAILERIFNILKQREKERDIKIALEQANKSTEKLKVQKEMRMASVKKYLDRRKDKKIKIKSKITRTKK